MLGWVLSMGNGQPINANLKGGNMSEINNLIEML